jgi:hypothetical protein
MAVCACSAGVDMTQEALKLALEALENGDVPTQENAGKNLDAITAIKEALAQKQEPVAWISPKGHIHFDPYLDSVPLYTTPPQRTWVGLTNDEVNNIAAGCHLGNSVQDAIFRAEAKLKEKNA